MFKPLITALPLVLLGLTGFATADDSICGCPQIQTNGDCTFWLGFAESPGADGTFSCGVWNGNCQQIAYKHDCDPGTVLTSPLKYTVDVDERGTGGGPDVGPRGLMAKVRYAGRTYGIAKRKDCSQGLVARSQGTFTFKCNL